MIPWFFNPKRPSDAIVQSILEYYVAGELADFFTLSRAEMGAMVG